MHLNYIIILELVRKVLQETGKELAKSEVIVGSKWFQLIFGKSLESPDVTFRPEPFRSHFLKAR